MKILLKLHNLIQYQLSYRPPATRSFLKTGFYTFIFVLLILSTWLEWKGMSVSRLVHYDYAFFYTAFQAILHHPAHQWPKLYQIASEQQFAIQHGFPYNIHNQYVYPPQFAVFWAFMGHLPWIWSARIWIVISILSYCLAVYLTLKMMLPHLRWPNLFFWIAASFLLTPVQIDIAAGNVNSILLTCLALAFYFHYYRKKTWIAALFLALTIVWKVTPAAVLLYFLLQKQWRLGAYTLLFSLLLTIWSSFYVGWSTLLHYVGEFVTFGQNSMKNGPAPYNQSILGVLADLAKHHWLSGNLQSLYPFYYLFVLTSAVLIVHFARQLPVSHSSHFALSSLTPLLFSPLIEEMHLIFALPALILVVSQKKYKIAAIGGWSSAVLLSLPTTFLLNTLTRDWPSLFFMHTQMFWTLMILFTVTLITMRQRNMLNFSQNHRFVKTDLSMNTRRTNRL
ncbi:Protein of unknown function [Alicyclobacillus tolerans]|uniref:DUF2029 domain-containing protein n=2 Tax=Alicyclobacillus tolerans TaxID=90970 RepID=A0A1M6PRN5_9BACL|nr:Protein of unknown function [Alicyclobacillus montanus]